MGGGEPVTGTGRPRRWGTLIERIAMELRQIEAEDLAARGGYRYNRTAEETWEPISDLLRAGYRRDARRLLKVMRAWVAKP